MLQYLYLGVSMQVQYILYTHCEYSAIHSRTVTIVLNILCFSGSSVSLKYCRQKSAS